MEEPERGIDIRRNLHQGPAWAHGQMHVCPPIMRGFMNGTY